VRLNIEEKPSEALKISKWTSCILIREAIKTFNYEEKYAYLNKLKLFMKVL
jgi:hypothetical protein